MTRVHVPDICDTPAEQAAYYADLDAATDRQRGDYDPAGLDDAPSCGTGRCVHAEWGLDCPPDPWADHEVVTCPRCETDHHTPCPDGICECGMSLLEES